MSEPKKCAHASCTCMTTEKYCSTYCEENKDTVEIVCRCNHAGCEAEIKRTPARSDPLAVTEACMEEI